jgi:hypothetical protein
MPGVFAERAIQGFGLLDRAIRLEHDAGVPRFWGTRQIQNGKCHKAIATRQIQRE